MTRPPVRDWFTDFDPLDPRWVEDPFPIWDEMRRSCPVAHTDRYNGVYFLSRYEDVRAAAYDTDHFSSRRIFVRETAMVDPATPPITADPPRHRPSRVPLLPRFSPEAVKELEAPTQAICRELIGKLIEKERCDVAGEYALHIPMYVLIHMFGVSRECSAQYRKWVLDNLERGITDHALYLKSVVEMRRYFQELVKERRSHPGKDLISYLAALTYDDKPLPDRQIQGTLALLLIAGIETTASTLCSTFWYLASHPDDLQRLVAEPELLPAAIEEFLRAFSPLTVARDIMPETELGGCTFKTGEMAILSFPSANRDPEVFEDPNSVIMDRKDINRHLAFGIGIHRCLGLHLARMEMRVALEEWLQRIPEFSFDRSVPIEWPAGPFRGPRNVPIFLRLQGHDNK
jgi:cytochrome P450